MGRLVNGSLVKRLLQEMPDVPSRRLAKVLRKRHPKVWSTDNAAYMAIRQFRGAAGVQNRRKIRPAQIRTEEEVENCQKFGLAIPPSDKNNWRWHDLPVGPERWGVIGDVHVPYHDERSCEVAFEHISKECDGLLLLGDIVDAYAMSRFCRNPEARDTIGEVAIVCKLLDYIGSLGLKKVVWKCGNHEARLETYLRQQAPELAGLQKNGVPFNSYRMYCDLDERGIDWVPNTWPMRHKHLAIVHGHEWGGGWFSPVNPARSAYLKSHECVMVGHEHRTSEHTEKTMFDTTVTCWSIGCLCDLHPEYRPFNKWNHGFAIIDVAGSSWKVENYRIVNGEVV